MQKNGINDKDSQIHAMIGQPINPQQWKFNININKYRNKFKNRGEKKQTYIVPKSATIGIVALVDTFVRVDAFLFGYQLMKVFRNV